MGRKFALRPHKFGKDQDTTKSDYSIYYAID